MTFENLFSLFQKYLLVNKKVDQRLGTNLIEIWELIYLFTS